MKYSDPDYWIQMIYKVWDGAMGNLNITPFSPAIDQTILATAVFIISLIILLLVFRGLRNKIEHLREKEWLSLGISGYRLISAEEIVSVFQWFLKLLRLALILVTFYLYITIATSFFRNTRDFATLMLHSVFNTISFIISKFIDFIPNGIAIIIILFLGLQVMRLSKGIMDAVDEGKVRIPGFHKEWANPTEKILKFFVIVLTIIFVAPMLPGFDTPAFKGVSVFVGVIFSLGSTATISNIVAGYALIYMRAFKVGDRVIIGEVTGDIEECTMLITRIRTLKNESVTIPNGQVLTKNIVNYSTLAKKNGVIVHTSVTIGYDVPWRKVHELLLKSTENIVEIDKSKEPFILQKSLNDYSVHYELNAYTNKPDAMPRILSDIHGSIQDLFSEAKIEILSPTYIARRENTEDVLPVS